MNSTNDTVVPNSICDIVPLQAITPQNDGGTTFIYSLSCPITKKVRYIGKSNTPYQRYLIHTNPKHEKSNIHKKNWIVSLQKNGLNPELHIIDEVPMSEWVFWEQHFISLYKSWGFDLVNIAIGGNGGSVLSSKMKEHLRQKRLAYNGFKGKHHTLESRKRMSENHPRHMKGKKHSIESRLKISNSKKGKPSKCIGFKHSDETKRKWSEARKGRRLSLEWKSKIGRMGVLNKRFGTTLSPEIKDKIRKSTLKLYRNGYTNPSQGQLGENSNAAKIVYQYNLSGESVGMFYGFPEAERKLNLKHNVIWSALKSKHHYSHGFIWSNKELDNIEISQYVDSLKSWRASLFIPENRK